MPEPAGVRSQPVAALSVWQAGTLESCDFTLFPFTGNAPFRGIHSSHGRS